MSSFYVPGQFTEECNRAMEIFRKVWAMVDRKAVDEADAYMATVLVTEGRRLYETVLTMVAAAKEIPPKDAH